MKEKIVKLIDVKTIITFALIASTIGLAYTGRIEPKVIAEMCSMAVIFFLVVSLGREI